MLIINARLCDATKDQVGDLRIEADRITQVGQSLAPEFEESVYDAKGCVLLPGAVDLHFHLSDPGRSRIESMAHSVSLALGGGITTLLAAPDTTPAIDNETVVEYLLAKAAAFKGARILTSGEIAKSGKLNNLAKLFKAGVLALQGQSNEDGNILRRALEYGLMADRPVLIECLDTAIAGSGVMHDGEVAARLGLPAVPDFAESMEVARVVELSSALEAKVLIQSLSAARSVAALGESRSSKVAAEVLLTHLLLDESACEGFNTAAKLTPPLRSSADRDALIEAVRHGAIDLIASGHQPQDQAAKDRPFELAASGASVAQYFLPLAHHYLVTTGKLSFSELSRAISANPAALIGLETGRLEAGYLADLVLFDPNMQSVVTTADGLAPSPWEGITLKGAVKAAWVAGNPLL